MGRFRSRVRFRPFGCVLSAYFSKACTKAHFNGRETAKTTIMHTLPSTPPRMLGIWRGMISVCMSTLLVGSSRVARRMLSGIKLGLKLIMAGRSFTRPVSKRRMGDCHSLMHLQSGLIVLERNYLDVFPYDKWNDNELPNFIEGEEYIPSEVELRDGQTTKPNLLTEADLVSLMDKNGIGWGFFLSTLTPDL